MAIATILTFLIDLARCNRTVIAKIFTFRIAVRTTREPPRVDNNRSVRFAAALPRHPHVARLLTVYRFIRLIVFIYLFCSRYICPFLYTHINSLILVFLTNRIDFLRRGTRLKTVTVREPSGLEKRINKRISDRGTRRHDAISVSGVLNRSRRVV